MNSEYDIRSIFEEMELELIRSMRRNLAKHQKWEEDEGINWTMWQAEQLKSFDKFKKENEKIFGKRFATVNAEIRGFLEHTYETAGLDQEKEILNALANNKKIKEKTKKGLEGSFFNLNKKKMNALINATTNDLSKAEHAMLRLTNDQYRKIIYKAETMFNSGGFTLKQAIDAASKDFLKAGINCVEYKDGRRVNIASYAEMCLRTSNKRAKFTAEGDVRKSYGITTVKISRYGGCSETCLPWQGRVYVDDVWSGGTKEEAEDKKLPLLSTAIEGGLFHPNCKHSMFTYYYDRKKAMGKLQEDGVEVTPEEQEHKRNHLHIQQQKRLEEGSLDPQNIQEARHRKEQWIEKDEELLADKPILSSLRKKVKGLLVDNKVVSYDELPEKIRVNFESSLKNADQYVNKILQSHVRETDYSIGYDASKFSHRNIIKLENENISPSTLAHELFHMIDYKYGITNNDIFRKALEEDYKRIIYISNGDVLSYFCKKYPNAFFKTKKGNVKIREKYCGISDIISALSNDQIHFGYHHEEDYWKKDSSRLSKEAWAQYGRIGFDNDDEVFEMLLEEFENFNKIALSELKKIAKK